MSKFTVDGRLTLFHIGCECDFFDFIIRIFDTGGDGINAIDFIFIINIFNNTNWISGNRFAEPKVCFAQYRCDSRHGCWNWDICDIGNCRRIFLTRETAEEASCCTFSPSRGGCRLKGYICVRD